MKPPGWLATTLLFGVPAVIFAFLFHWLGPDLWRQGTSWWRIFHLLLVLPLALMLLAALIGAAIDLRHVSWRVLRQRLRLSLRSVTVWLWAAALSEFMYGGNWADLVAVAASWFALWNEKTNKKWMFVATLIAVFVKRNAALLQPALQSPRFFDPSGFYSEFFSHFGPHDFMGLPLQGAWWIPAYYAVVMLVCNIGGEELWWRGYVLPDRNSHLAGLRGLSMVFLGQSFTYSCSRRSGTRSGWQLQVSRFPLLPNVQKAPGQALSATASATCPSF
jgi:hypothetical protein